MNTPDTTQQPARHAPDDDLGRAGGALEDVYTRKVGGEQYRYRLSWEPGAQNAPVRWRAEVFYDGALKGTPSGSFDARLLDAAGLRQQLIANVEIIIESMQGIAE